MNLNMNGVEEKREVIKKKKRIGGIESERRSRMRWELNVKKVIEDREKMGKVLDIIDIGEIKSKLIIMMESELGEEEGRRGRSNIEKKIVEVKKKLIGLNKIKKVRIWMRKGIGKKWIIKDKEDERVDIGEVKDSWIMRLRKDRKVVKNKNIIEGNIDEMVVIRIERKEIEVKVIGEIVKRNKKIEIKLIGLENGDVIVERMIMKVEIMKDRIEILEIEWEIGVLNVKFEDMDVDEESSIGVEIVIIGSVKW